MKNEFLEVIIVGRAGSGLYRCECTLCGFQTTLESKNSRYRKEIRASSEKLREKNELRNQLD